MRSLGRWALVLGCTLSAIQETITVSGQAPLIQQRRLDEAIHVLTSSIGLEPRAPNAHNNLGIVLAQQQLPRARASFERALALDPAHVNARRNLERTMAILSTGRPER